MKSRVRSLLMLLLFFALPLAAEWKRLGPGVDFQKFRRNNANYYVARVDLTNDRIRVVGTQERDRGMPVSSWAKQIRAIVATNGDYFDEEKSHSHFAGTQPRIVFVEFWGDDDAVVIARAVRNALDLMGRSK